MSRNEFLIYKKLWIYIYKNTRVLNIYKWVIKWYDIILNDIIRYAFLNAITLK